MKYPKSNISPFILVSATLIFSLTLSSCAIKVFSDDYADEIVAVAPGDPDIGSAIYVDVSGDRPDASISEVWTKYQIIEGNVPSRMNGTLEKTVSNPCEFSTTILVPSENACTASFYFYSAFRFLPILHIDLMFDGTVRIDDRNTIGRFEYDKPIKLNVKFKPTESTLFAELKISSQNITLRESISLNPLLWQDGGIRTFTIKTPVEIEVPNGEFYIKNIQVLEFK